MENNKNRCAGWRINITENFAVRKVLCRHFGRMESYLVDRNHYIPNNYQVELTELSNGKKVDSRIYPELQQMFNDARAEGWHCLLEKDIEQQKNNKKLWTRKSMNMKNKDILRKKQKKSREICCNSRYKRTPIRTEC